MFDVVERGIHTQQLGLLNLCGPSYLNSKPEAEHVTIDDNGLQRGDDVPNTLANRRMYRESRPPSYRSDGILIGVAKGCDEMWISVRGAAANGKEGPKGRQVP